ncbi:hypothetical protein [Fodinicurvata sp. EGI_FJ10296]|uniref:hypothetical protein n=1 Tax=Fodinicurvata sp. EGI_FJ10296 TaxID=3231908 RepID=UPI003453D9BD
MSEGEFILCSTEDGAAEIRLRAVDGTVWLSLSQIADLFGRDKSVISRHIKAIFEDAELSAEAVVAPYATAEEAEQAPTSQSRGVATGLRRLWVADTSCVSCCATRYSTLD